MNFLGLIIFYFSCVYAATYVTVNKVRNINMTYYAYSYKDIK